MRIGSIELAACALFVLPLGGCTTIASKVAVVPPGTNKYSFRECLLNRGFYSKDALTGIAKSDWEYRHNYPGAKNSPPPPDRYYWLEQKDSVFVANAARIISEGLMPAQQFWEPDTDGSAQADGTAVAPTEHYDDRGVNHPYVDEAAPQRFPLPEDKVQTDVALPSEAYSLGLNWRLNRFLDCYVAPVGVLPAKGTMPSMGMAPDGPSEHGDEDIEGRQLRGHILLALLAQYGTELIVSHASKRQVAQAELLLGHVKDAEISLRKASVIMDEEARKEAIGFGKFLTATDVDGKDVALEAPAGATDQGEAGAAAGRKAAWKKVHKLTIADFRGEAQFRLAWSEYTTRLLRVFQVGVDIQRIDAEQTLDRFSNLIAAFSGPVTGFESVLKDGLAGFVSVQKIKLYGGAYIRDARGTLAVVRASSTWTDGNWTYDVKTVQRGWKLWDDEITRTCLVLATVAKRDPANANCIPAGSSSKDEA